jgi:hypothetical protein
MIIMRAVEKWAFLTAQQWLLSGLSEVRSRAHEHQFFLFLIGPNIII